MGRQKRAIRDTVHDEQLGIRGEKSISPTPLFHARLFHTNVDCHCPESQPHSAEWLFDANEQTLLSGGALFA